SQGEMLLLHHSPDLKWSPWSDSHRRIRVYETRPVAAEARGRWKMSNDEFRMTKCSWSPVDQPVSSFDLRVASFKIGAPTWICTTNFRLRRAACRTNYTLRAKWHP